MTIAGIGESQAQDLVHGADAICPYSNAIRGNIEVGFMVNVR